MLSVGLYDAVPRGRRAKGQKPPKGTPREKEMDSLSISDEEALDRFLARPEASRLMELCRWKDARNPREYKDGEASQLADDLLEALHSTRLPADETAVINHLLHMAVRCRDEGLFLLGLPD